MSLSKKKILIYSPGKNILHRDLVDSNFYSFLNKSFDITWIFPEEPSEQFKKTLFILILDIFYSNL